MDVMKVFLVGGSEDGREYDLPPGTPRVVVAPNGTNLANPAPETALDQYDIFPGPWEGAPHVAVFSGKIVGQEAREQIRRMLEYARKSPKFPKQ